MLSNHLLDSHGALREIRPVDENLISKLPNITYGVVPPGFQQTIPETGTPRLLVEKTLYEAGGPAFEANGGSIRFTIKDGKIVIVSDGPLTSALAVSAGLAKGNGTTLLRIDFAAAEFRICLGRRGILPTAMVQRACQLNNLFQAETSIFHN